MSVLTYIVVVASTNLGIPNQMKRLLFVLLSAFLFHPCSFSREVKPAAAQKKAELFFQQIPLTKAGSGRLSLVRCGDTLSQGHPAYYVYQRNGGGFVVVAGDDVVQPVLGYSYDGLFPSGDLPVNVRWWLSEIADGIDRACVTKTSHASSSPVTKASEGPFVRKVLNTPKWNQGEPYNRLTPERTLTGCVATAMAEFIAYHRYPERPVGVIPSYTFSLDGNDYTVPETDLNGRHYAFDDMTGDNISRLMADCGFAVQMKYGHSASSASYSVDAMVRYFRYSANGVELYARYFSSRDWLAMLRMEIDDGSPVLYSGRNEMDGGHAFLVDGYDEEGKLHINFGWGGNHDGYYMFPAFGDYSLYHRAIIGLRPFEGGEPLPLLAIEKTEGLSGIPGNGLSCDNSTFIPETPFTVRFSGVIRNLGRAHFSGSVYLARIDSTGSFQEIASEAIGIELDAKIGFVFSLSLKCALSDLDEGDYLALYCARDGDYEPEKVFGDDESSQFNTLIQLVDGTPELGSVSQLTYDKESGMLTLQVPHYVRCTLLDAAGKDCSAAHVPAADGRILFDAKSLGAGAYDLILQAATRRKRVTITF